MLSTLFIVLYYIADIYQYIFMIYIILGFFPVSENNIFVRIIRGLSEPLYEGVMRFLPRLVIGMIDLSPLYVFILLNIIQFICQRLASMFA
jgi:YggT family protein